MKKVVLFGLLFLFLAACQPSAQQQITMPEPKVMVQCWDGSVKTSAELCPPIQETKPIEQSTTQPTIAPTLTVQEAVPEKSTTLMQELLEKTPKTYWFNEGQYGVVVSGNKRSTGEYDQYWNYVFRLMYWNTDNKTVYVLAPYHVAESWWINHTTGKYKRPDGIGATTYFPAFFALELTGNKDVDKTRIPKEFNRYWYDAKESEITRLVQPFYIKSPTDWMKEYSDQIPVKIDKTKKMLPWRGSNKESELEVHYVSKENPNWVVVFGFINEKYNMPAVVQILDSDGGIVKRYSYDFDTTYFKQGKTNVKVTEKLTELPPNSVIVTVYDMEAWFEYMEG